MTPTNSPRNADYRRRCEAKPFHMYFIAKRGECRTKGFECDLDADYLESIWTGTCPVFGCEIAKPFSAGVGKGSTYTAHLDRHEPSKGYVKGNVSWISGRANRIKYDASIEELEKIVHYMKQNA